MTNKESDIDLKSYVSKFPKEQQEVLAAMRKIIRQAAPEAKEVISYGMPTYQQHGNLVHYGMAKNHLGFYPGPSGISSFKKELVDYKTSKGAIQFPLNKPLPQSLIKNIVALRIKENEDRHHKKFLRTCSKGHQYHKSSDCPTCPVCEADNKPASGFLSLLSNPARRALVHEGINTLTKLATYSEKEILQMHGIGKASLPVLRQALADAGLAFQP